MTDLAINLPLVAVTWLVAAAMNYGLLKGRLEAQEERIKRVESVVLLMVPRSEYESRHTDLVRTQTRIDAKLDLILARGSRHRSGDEESP